MELFYSLIFSYSIEKKPVPPQIFLSLQALLFRKFIFSGACVATQD